jgi:hypothetical protein
MRAFLLLLPLLAGCAPCLDCFTIELQQFSAPEWEPCCTYERDGSEDPLFVRFTRTGTDSYQAGVAIGCRHTDGSTPFQAELITRNGESLDPANGINLDFDEGTRAVTLAVECDSPRPAPAYPQVLIDLLDPDLAGQFDAPDDRLVIDEVPGGDWDAL